MAARPSGLSASIEMAPENVSRSMPAEKCLPVLEITKALALPSLFNWCSTVSSSRQNVGCMVLSDSGLFSTKCATWSFIVKEKQLSLSMGIGLVQCRVGGVLRTVACVVLRDCPVFDQGPYTDAQQAKFAGEVDAL